MYHEFQITVFHQCYALTGNKVHCNTVSDVFDMSFFFSVLTEPVHHELSYCIMDGWRDGWRDG